MTTPATAFFMALALAAGISIAAQQIINGGFREAVGSVWWAGLVSYLGGTLFMIVALLVVRDRMPSLAVLKQAPAISWVGGLLGGLYIALSLLVLPRLGVALALALIVVGQMVASLAFDHFGLFGVPQHAISATRIAGAGVLVLGVLLLRLG